MKTQSCYVNFYFDGVAPEQLHGRCQTLVGAFLHHKDPNNKWCEVQLSLNMEGIISWDGEWPKPLLSKRSYTPSQHGYVKALLRRDHLTIGRHEEDADITQMFANEFEKYLKDTDVNYKRVDV